MNCPVCSTPMKLISQDISYNTAESGIKYDRAKYQCEADDVWILVEIPKKSDV